MEEFKAKLIMFNFKKIDSWYNYKDISVRVFIKTGTVFISCDKLHLKPEDNFISHEDALPIIIDLL